MTNIVCIMGIGSVMGIIYYIYSKYKILNIIKGYVKSLGGPLNIQSLRNAENKIDITVRDVNLVKDKELIHLGVSAIIRKDEKKIRLILTKNTNFLTKRIQKYLQNKR